MECFFTYLRLLYFLSSVLEFSVYRPFISLVKFNPGYFILFDAVINWIVFLISFSDHLLLVYRTIIDFCVLILYPMTLLNLVA